MNWDNLDSPLSIFSFQFYRFTLAHTVQESKSLANLQEEYNQEKHKPICHSKSSSSGVCLLPQTNSQSEVTGGGGGDPSATAAEDLLRSVHRFLASCKLKDQSTISGLWTKYNTKSGDILFHSFSFKT